MAVRTVPGIRPILMSLLVAAVAGCATAPTPESAPEQQVSTTVAEPTPTFVDPAGVAANELGAVPILMYHQVSANPAGEYDQTPEEFRAELDRLYREGYRPVTAADYISGRIDIPAGTHPVVLTFDDSTVSQFAFTPDGRPTPECAIGILEEFGASRPDFGPTATLYVNDDPFTLGAPALTWLAAHGYEIGAHTAGHAALARLDGDGVQRELAENVRAIEVSGVRVRTMALPFGLAPADRSLARQGSWAGTSYSFEAVMLVGAGPAPSPFGPVDPIAVPRIRSGRGEVDFDSAYWLDRLAETPERRYTSDGDPARISFPTARAGELAAQWSSRATPY
ncbi:polysaccharide deacetylase family protein [Nocardia noduli]|uniref:polysaccharide deacetylase family protein n=1 Tax=Nocardia noduli TaxID=2815722 RepID=UPI0020B27EE2|nr:polysaccharide deacetylase family protein [Nocardia noduli]